MAVLYLMYACILLYHSICADHHERPVSDAEEDAPVPEGAEQGQSNHSYLTLS